MLICGLLKLIQDNLILIVYRFNNNQDKYKYINIKI